MALQDALQVAEQVAEVTIKQDLQSTELKLELKIAETKSELVRWVVGIGMLQTVLIAAMILELLPH